MPTTRTSYVNASVAAAAAALTAAVAYRVHTGLVNALTGTLLLLAAGAVATVVARLAVGAMSSLRPWLPHVTLLLATTTSGLLAAEAALRLIGAKSTYGELNGGALYRSVYKYDNPTWYHTYIANSRFTEKKTEFVHDRVTNSLGLSEQELPTARPTNEYRILALGDSFTEGVGADYEDSWVRVVERNLSPLPDGRTVRAFDAGMSGSDPLLERVLFRDKLTAFRPDIVIVALNNSDVADVIVRGGQERFRPDGRIVGDRAPWWDWIYGSSYITRHVVHDLLGYTWLLMSPADQRRAEASARTLLNTEVGELAALSRSIDARFVLVVSPHEYEVKAGAYEPGFKPLVDQLARERPDQVIDVLEYFKKDGQLTPANSGDFYWSLDYHHNARGYALMGRAIIDGLRTLHVLAAGGE